MKILRMLLPNQQSVDYTLDAMLHLNAVQGAAYSVVDLESGLVVEQAVLTREADTLLIEIDGEQIATVEQFYAQGMAASVDTGSQAQQVAANDAVAESADLVWELAADAGALADGGILTAPLMFAGAVVAGGLYVATNNDDDAAVIPQVTVVFDLVEGVSSSHSDRTFDPDVEYTIYIRIQTGSTALSTDGPTEGSAAEAAGATWGMWDGGANLGADDTIILVGDDAGVGVSVIPGMEVFQLRPLGYAVMWDAPPVSGSPSRTYDVAAGMHYEGWFWLTGAGSDRGQTYLWEGEWGSAPGRQATTPAEATGFNALNTMPAGILTSQGLA
ncbi:MAG: hypothetical protein ACJAWL_000174 [Motiliproteus sp.]|jgi:hypothetical protein